MIGIHLIGIGDIDAIIKSINDVIIIFVVIAGITHTI